MTEEQKQYNNTKVKNLKEKEVFLREFIFFCK